MPKTSTGPAILNIFAPIPNICPSDLNSMAGETIAFEKPVMGTSVPAPANLAIFAKSPRAVSSAARAISDMDADVFDDGGGLDPARIGAAAQGQRQRAEQR